MTQNLVKPVKPLGHRAYGSIPHLPGSRMGPGDHHCHEGQARIATERVRDRHDTVYVQEKLDGSCMSVARIDDDIVALGRAGYPASTSPFEQHHLFADWVDRHESLFRGLLYPGERAVGEWLAQAHGTRYVSEGLEPFVLFDIMQGHERTSLRDLQERNCGLLPMPCLLAEGPTSIDAAMEALAKPCYHGALDAPEGAVWRVERKDRVDFLTKYVRPDKVDGCYLPEITGGDPIWNWRPAA